MLVGELVVLRSRRAGDVDVLEHGSHDDVVTWSRTNSGPWKPRVLGEASPFGELPPDERTCRFTVAGRDDGAVLGSALLWDVDLFNRSAHVGVALLAEARGRGVGTDVVAVLCRYGFEMLGLHRLQIETLEDNVAMIRAARASGFRLEGASRDAAWFDGAFMDEVIYSVLEDEWRAVLGAH